MQWKKYEVFAVAVGYIESRKYNHVVYLDLYEYEGTIYLTNDTQVEFLPQLYGCSILHLEKPMKIHSGAGSYCGK
ncbi:hypothetical protein TU67_12065 [Bacillus cereus]|nr:hypothetical protein TU67_12065 [Bacillus cereus]